MINYLDKAGVQNLWNNADNIFARKSGAEEVTKTVAGRVATADNNSKNVAKRIEIQPTSGSISSVNLYFCSKNILPNPGTKTINGVTFSYDDDGYLTLNGKATAQADYYFIGTAINDYQYFAPIANYTFYVEKVSGSGNVTFYCVVSDTSGTSNGGIKIQIDDEGEDTYTPIEGRKHRIMLRVASGKTISNLKLKVQVEYGNSYTGYEPPSRISVPINLNGNTIGSEEKLVISEDGSCKILKSDSTTVDISGSYNFSQLNVPSFAVFNGVLNSDDTTSVQYYTLQLGTQPPSNSELRKYLSGSPSSLLGNEPIIASNLLVLLDLMAEQEPSEPSISATFNIRQGNISTGSMSSSTTLQLTQVTSSGITVSGNTITVPKKCTVNISGSLSYTVNAGYGTFEARLYAVDQNSNYYLLGSKEASVITKTQTLTVDGDIELPANSNTLKLIPNGTFSGREWQNATITAGSAPLFISEI